MRSRSRPTLERLPRRRRERGHALLEQRGARVLCTELAAHVAPVDRLAEDRRLPQRERLEPRERAELTAAALRVPRDELGRATESLRSAVTGDDPSALAAPFGSLYVASR